MVLEYEDGDVLFDNDMGSILKNIIGSGIDKDVLNEFDFTTTGGMSINLDTGAFILNLVHYQRTTTGSATFGAAHASLHRKDLVVINASKAFVVVAGTPSVSPKPPNIPVDTVPLYEVYIGAAVTEILAGDVRDFRHYAPIHGDMLHELRRLIFTADEFYPEGSLVTDSRGYYKTIPKDGSTRRTIPMPIHLPYAPPYKAEVYLYFTVPTTGTYNIQTSLLLANVGGISTITAFTNVVSQAFTINILYKVLMGTMATESNVYDMAIVNLVNQATSQNDIQVRAVTVEFSPV